MSSQGTDGAKGAAAQAMDQDSIDKYLGIGFDANANAGPSAIEALVSSRETSIKPIPLLDAIFERMLGLLKVSVRKFMSDTVELRLTKPQPFRFSEYISAVHLPAVFGLLRSTNWNGPALIVMDAHFVSTIIEVVFGGRADQPPPTVDGRGFSPVEMSILRRFIGLVLTEVNEAFSSVGTPDFSFDHFETNPRFASIAAPQSSVMVADIRVEVGPLRGAFHIIIPLATLDPIREVLSSGQTVSLHAKDDTWASSLAREVFQANAELEVELFAKQISLRELLTLSVGGTFMSDAKSGDPVKIKCGQVAIASAQLGRVDDRAAVTITSMSPDERRPYPTSSAG